MPNEQLYSSAALADILTQIDELSEYEISVTENPDTRDLQICIGDSCYNIAPDDSVVEVEIPEEDMTEVTEGVADTYDRLQEDNVESDTVESGTLSQILKTLLVGGIVRLTTKLLK